MHLRCFSLMTRERDAEDSVLVPPQVHPAFLTTVKRHPRRCCRSSLRVSSTVLPLLAFLIDRAAAHRVSHLDDCRAHCIELEDQLGGRVAPMSLDARAASDMYCFLHACPLRCGGGWSHQRMSRREPRHALM